MSKKIILICICLIAQLAIAQAATLKGRILDNNGEPLPFASLYIKGTTKGTTSNVEGYYSIELPVGKHMLICQYVGFQKKEMEFDIVEGENKENIKLQLSGNDIKEITIQSGENQALAIIKKTIKKRAYYNKEIDAFKANAYIKGTFKLDEIPDGNTLYKLMNGSSGDDSKKELEESKGIIMLSESMSEIAYKRPDKLKINVKSSRVSGNKNSYGFSDPIFVNLYDNNVDLGSQLTPRGLISPIADAAILSYRYVLLSAYIEDGKLINRIQVIPKRKFEPLFSGIIDIIENEWRLHSVDLTADHDHQLEVVDTVKIKQIFVPVKNTLMVKDQSFYIKLKLMGFGITGNFVNIFSDYQFNYDEKNTFNRFAKEYDESALQRSVAYWDTMRPVPLNAEEIADFVKKDSIEKAEKDTVEKNKNGIMKIVFSGYSQNIDSSKKISTSSLINITNFNWNTAEGLNYSYDVKYRKQYHKDRVLTTKLFMRYGVSNQQFNAKLSSAYYFGKTNKSKIAWSGGRYVFQYNNENPVSPLLNSFYTLVSGLNYLKIYQAWFGKVYHEYRHFSGFAIKNELSYQARNPLYNTNLYSFNKSTAFTENYPTERIPAMEAAHNAFIYRLQFAYQPGRKYIKYPDRIVSTSSPYPTFRAQLVMGLPTLGSDVDYSKWKVSVTDDMSLNLWGQFNYKLALGGFLHNTKSYLADYTHFNGNQMILASPYLNSFQLAPYYLNSNTQALYMTLNAEHHYNGLLTNKIPLFRRLKWNLVTATNSYYVNQNNNYMEVSVGLENIGYKIFRIIRVDGVAGYTNFKNPVYGVRIGIKSSVFSFDGGDDD